MDNNVLYYGDNLDILRRYLDDETVDLIYLAPPFNSQQAYNVEAANAGFYRLPWHESQRFPKIQILTIEQLLAGAQVACPPLHHAHATFKQAPKAKRPKAKTTKMELEQ